MNQDYFNYHNVFTDKMFTKLSNGDQSATVRHEKVNNLNSVCTSLMHGI